MREEIATIFRRAASPAVSVWTVRLLAVAALVEFALALHVAWSGPVGIRFGPVSISASGAQKPALYGVMLSAVALWLSEYASTPSRARVPVVQVAFVLGSVGLMASLAALASPMAGAGFVQGHDVFAHGTHAVLFDRALSQGQFPVRWVEWVAPGYGQPLFNHYQVGFYYLVSLVHAAGPSLATALKLTVTGLWAAGAGFMYLLCRPHGRMPALVAAAVFAGSPYLLLDVYVRAAYTELAALAFVPALLLALDRTLRTGSVLSRLALSGAVLLVAICHLPTGMILAPLVVAYAAFLLLTGQATGRRLAAAAAFGGLGVGLAAFYVVPALWELGHISMGRMTSGYFDYRLHFVEPSQWFERRWGFGPSGSGREDEMSLQVGIVQWTMAGAALAAGAMAMAAGRRLQAAHIAFWLGVLALALLMTTEYAAPLWALVPPLSFVQFPWRFLLLTPIATGVAAALALALIRHQTLQALLAVCLVVTPPYWTRDYMTAAADRSRLLMDIGRAGWPATPDEMAMVFREAAYDPHNRSPGAPPPERWAVTRGTATLDVEWLRDAGLALRVESPGAFGLMINVVHTPGWRVWIDGEEREVGTESGRMLVDVPAGSRRVEARFGNTPVRTAANAVSLASFGLWVALAIAGAGNRGPAGPGRPVRSWRRSGPDRAP